MGHKTSGQLGFADAWLGNNPKRNQRLDKLDRLLDWTLFEKLHLLFAEVLLFFWFEFSFIPKLRAYSQFTS